MSFKMIEADSVDGLSNSSISRIFIEVNEGAVVREVGIGDDGKPCYMYPSSSNDRSFRGLFDLQLVEDTFGEEVSGSDFINVWELAKSFEQRGILRRNV